MPRYDDAVLNARVGLWKAKREQMTENDKYTSKDTNGAAIGFVIVALFSFCAGVAFWAYLVPILRSWMR
jgi:hypothetical protein